MSRREWMMKRLRRKTSCPPLCVFRDHGVGGDQMGAKLWRFATGSFNARLIYRA